MCLRVEILNAIEFDNEYNSSGIYLFCIEGNTEKVIKLFNQMNFTKYTCSSYFGKEWITLDKGTTILELSEMTKIIGCFELKKHKDLTYYYLNFNK